MKSEYTQTFQHKYWCHFWIYVSSSEYAAHRCFCCIVLLNDERCCITWFQMVWLFRLALNMFQEGGRAAEVKGHLRVPPLILPPSSKHSFQVPNCSLCLPHPLAHAHCLSPSPVQSIYPLSLLLSLLLFLAAKSPASCHSHEHLFTRAPVRPPQPSARHSVTWNLWLSRFATSQSYQCHLRYSEAVRQWVERDVHCYCCKRATQKLTTPLKKILGGLDMLPVKWPQKCTSRWAYDRDPSPSGAERARVYIWVAPSAWSHASRQTQVGSDRIFMYLLLKALWRKTEVISGISGHLEWTWWFSKQIYKSLFLLIVTEKGAHSLLSDG